ncbi:hypothetical protein UFOVP328_192 [uncultured Caudovirales phage]|uniref:Uncharacterized protein n=1 Tax=uncultured Caudovirales phage TaxID=2100421 RepID=A0A6J5M1V5_9CAUD|nr:hypothetical protein UFOVP328_192 [uncultured Caudovirales phage]
MENQTITVTDLGAIKNIIDLACTRGAFRADEMQQVGELYNKLNNFLEAIVAHAQAQAGSEENKGE